MLTGPVLCHEIALYLQPPLSRSRDERKILLFYKNHRRFVLCRFCLTKGLQSSSFVTSTRITAMSQTYLVLIPVDGSKHSDRAFDCKYCCVACNYNILCSGNSDITYNTFTHTHRPIKETPWCESSQTIYFLSRLSVFSELLTIIFL